MSQRHWFTRKGLVSYIVRLIVYIGLFLKSIGMALEQALAFWKQEFTRKITEDQFQRQYAYNVRHMYGMEGGRRKYI